MFARTERLLLRPAWSEDAAALAAAIGDEAIVRNLATAPWPYALEHAESFIARELPFGRFGTAEEVGNVVAFLSSPRAGWISGTSVVVDGCQSRAF